MIENALVFALGAFFSAILALLLYPAFTSRAARLARRELEARLPMTAAEIAAAKDGVRAELAARTARVIHDLEATRRDLVDERLARAEEQVELASLRSERHGVDESLRLAEQRLAEVRAELRQREDQLARLMADRRDLDRQLASERRRGADAEARAGEAERLAWEMRDALLLTEQAAAELVADAALDPIEPSLLPPRPVVDLHATAADRIDASASEEEREAQETNAPTLATATREEIVARVRRIRTWIGGDEEASEGILPQEPEIAPEPADDEEAADPAPYEDEGTPVIAAETTASPEPASTDEAAALPTVIGTVADGAGEPAALPMVVTDRPAPSLLDLTPSERAQRIDDLARRLRNLRTRNATARARRDDRSGETDGYGTRE